MYSFNDEFFRSAIQLALYIVCNCACKSDKKVYMLRGIQSVSDHHDQQCIDSIFALSIVEHVYDNDS